MYKIKIDSYYISLQIGSHENNYFICNGIIFGNVAFTDISTKKTYIYNGNEMACIVCTDAIIHEMPLTTC